MSAPDTRRIDVSQLRALLRAYFIVSTRSMPVGITGAKRMRTLPFMLGLYALIGFLLGGMSFAIDSVFVNALVLHTLTFFVVGTMALNEASEVLFNSHDADVLGYRPVLPATLVLAKGLTIFGFCGLMAAAVNLGPCLLGAGSKGATGWFGPVHALSVLIETLFLCGAVVCVYGVIARFLGAERFQRLVTAAQVLSTILLVVGFQVFPRLAGVLEPSDFRTATSPVWLLPSAWFAALDAWLASIEPAPVYAPMAGVGIAITAVLLWLGVMRLPGGVSEPETRASAAPPAPRVDAGREPRGGWLALPVWSWWMRDPIERAVFRLCAVHLLRERALKVRLAASLGYFAVFPILMLLNSRGDRSLSLMGVWMCALVPLGVLQILRLSSTPESAELFLFTPLENPAALLHGARKAALVFIVLPLVVYASAVAAWASRETPERLWLLLPVVFVIPPLSMVSGLLGDYVPFSQAPRAGERSSQFLAVILSMIPLGVVYFVVYVAQKAGWFWPVLAVVLAVAIVAHVTMRRWIEKKARFALRRY